MTEKDLSKIEAKYKEFAGILSADIILRLCKEIRELWEKEGKREIQSG